jgi:serine/threonine protein kinase
MASMSADFAVAEIRMQRLCKAEPYIARMVDFSFHTPSRTTYMLTEFAQHGSLAPFKGAFTEEEVRFMAAGAVYQLYRFEQLEIIHRDIKPANLLIDSDGRLLFGDLGAAVQADARDGRLINEPEYIAPEVRLQREGFIIGTGAYGPAADVYSLGKCLKYAAQDLDTWSEAGTAFIAGVTQDDAAVRMTSWHALAHAWFSDVDWDSVKLRKVEAPRSLLEKLGQCF